MRFGRKFPERLSATPIGQAEALLLCLQNLPRFFFSRKPAFSGHASRKFAAEESGSCKVREPMQLEIQELPEH